MSEGKLTPSNLGRLQVVKPDQIEWLNILIYGDPGVGKTILCASASVVEELQPVLLVDAEAGTLSIRKMYPDVDVVKMSNFGDLKYIRDLLSSGKFPYKTVILDSISETQDIGMDDILAVQVAKSDRERDEDMPEQSDWGRNRNQIRKMIRAFKNAPCHFIVTALAKETDRGVIKPALAGQSANSVPGQMDEVLYMRVGEVPIDPQDPKKGKKEVRALLTRAQGKIFAKDRSTTLPDVVIEPTMQILFDYFTGKTVKED